MMYAMQILDVQNSNQESDDPPNETKNAQWLGSIDEI